MDNLKVVEEVMNITLRREVVTALNASCVGTSLDVGEFFKINHPVCKADYSMELHCCLVGLAQRCKTAYTFIIGIINNSQNDRMMEHKLKEVCIGLGVYVNLLETKLTADSFRHYVAAKEAYLLVLFQLMNEKNVGISSSILEERQTFIIDCTWRSVAPFETLDDHESDYSESDMEHEPGATQVVIDLTGEKEMLDLTLCQC